MYIDKKKSRIVKDVPILYEVGSERNIYGC